MVTLKNLTNTMYLVGPVRINRTRLMELASLDYSGWTWEDHEMADYFIRREAGWEVSLSSQKIAAFLGNNLSLSIRTYINPATNGACGARGALKVLTSR